MSYLNKSNKNNNNCIAGEVKIWSTSTLPKGWLLCDGSEVSRTQYSCLFQSIGIIYGSGNGTTTFNLPNLKNRIPIGAGQSTFISTFANTAINVSTNIITVSNNNSLYTGSIVTLTTTGSAPAGLIIGNTYYVIRLSSTTISLATTLANAVAGVAIDITSQGTGNHSLTITYTNRSLGEIGGEEMHSLNISEIPSHTHIYNDTYGVQDLEGVFNNATACDEISRDETTTATGGSQSHNNMQPFIAMNYIIKF